VAALFLTAACAAASYYLLERPLMRLGRGRSPRVLSRL
jgi:peptidoglycan/LPS O-acetylase OafA/YrhL